MNPKLKIISIQYHRNGVSGVPFEIIKFHVHRNKQILTAVVFETKKHIAVFNDIPNEKFRGDYFENSLRKEIEKWHHTYGSVT